MGHTAQMGQGTTCLNWPAGENVLFAIEGSATANGRAPARAPRPPPPPTAPRGAVTASCGAATATLGDWVGVASVTVFVARAASLDLSAAHHPQPSDGAACGGASARSVRAAQCARNANCLNKGGEEMQNNNKKHISKDAWSMLK